MYSITFASESELPRVNRAPNHVSGTFARPRCPTESTTSSGFPSIFDCWSALVAVPCHLIAFHSCWRSLSIKDRSSAEMFGTSHTPPAHGSSARAAAAPALTIQQTDIAAANEANKLWSLLMTLLSSGHVRIYAAARKKFKELKRLRGALAPGQRPENKRLLM